MAWAKGAIDHVKYNGFLHDFFTYLVWNPWGWWGMSHPSVAVQLMFNALFCRPLTANTSEHPTTRHIVSYMYALKTSSTETLQPAL